MSIASYDDQIAELQNLPIEVLVAQRLANFDAATAVSHADILAEFGAD